MPTRPAPGDADDVDQLRSERDQLRESVDRLTTSGAAARAASRAKSARLEAQLQALRNSDLSARQTNAGPRGEARGRGGGSAALGCGAIGRPGGTSEIGNL